MVLNNQPRKVKIRKIKSILKTALKDLGVLNCEISVLLTDDSGIRELNRTYLAKDRPTDVLSFPTGDEIILGDIVISIDRVIRQTNTCDKCIDEELARLLIHGLLHLLGYEHGLSTKKTREMRCKEKQLLSIVMKEDGR